jgi:hypothetical protein
MSKYLYGRQLQTILTVRRTCSEAWGDVHRSVPVPAAVSSKMTVLHHWLCSASSFLLLFKAAVVFGIHLPMKH